MGRLWKSFEDVDRSVEFVASMTKVQDGVAKLDRYVLAKYRQILRGAYLSHAVHFLEQLKVKCPEAVVLFEGIQPKEGKEDG